MKAEIDLLPCHVVLPAEWKNFYQRRGAVAPRDVDSRRFVRQHFPTRAIMELATSLAAVPRDYAKYAVLMKDISRQGASFLHVAQLFPGERIELTLSTGRIPYTVMRCRRHNDCCYEIGADIV